MINNLNEVEKISQEIYNMVTPNLISKEEIIKLLKNNLEIRYDRNFIKSGDNVKFVPFNQNYVNSIFIESLLDYIDIHNSKLIKDDVIVEMYTIHFFEIISKVVLEIGMDLLTYFKTFIYSDVINIFKLKSQEKNYTIPFEVENTIVVHLRLDDVRGYRDYDGRMCSSEFSKILNDDKILDNDVDSFVKNKYGNHTNSQSPIPFNRIQECLDDIKKENPKFNIVIVTNPGEDTTKIPYPVLSSNDESYDLFLLCNAKIVILSRSTFAISSLFFSDSETYYVPLWGHVPCFGLSSKFDKTNKIKYYY